MAEKFTVKEEDKLLNFLFSVLSTWSRKKVKERLKSNTVAINGNNTTKFDAPLKAEDIVEVGVVHKKSSAPITSLEIIYQDTELIAINKPAGLLSVGTTKENKQHALALLRTQLSRPKHNIKLWPVHRLDRETSGVLLFATSKEVREAVMATWGESEKTYLAIVEGTPKERKGTINKPLRLDEKEYRMHVEEHPLSKHAVTHYRVKESAPVRSLLEVNIETGRQHQIRAHMAWRGHSIVGDERYGTKGVRMGLHALRLSIVHPKSKKTLCFEIDAPRDFYELIK